MMKIGLLNKIAAVGTDQFDRAKYDVSSDLENADAIMVRSAAMHDMALPEKLKAIARAGAGVNNIPVDECAKKGIVVFNTPGANANGVKELTIAALLLASRDIIGSVNWSGTLTENVAKSVEAGKSAFAGCEIKGKTLGVIGLGAIGSMVADAAVALGMKVIGCDPYISVSGAWKMNPAVKKAETFDDVYAAADYITLHVPATPATKNMINADSISKMKDGVKLINLSRADLVSAADVKSAIADGKIAKYVTDFPTEETVNEKNIITISHLGASTAESEDNCAVMAADELIGFLEYGSIRNSVNFPAVTLGGTPENRAVILYSKDADAASALPRSPKAMAMATKGDYAAMVADFDEPLTADEVAALTEKDGIIRVIVL